MHTDPIFTIALTRVEGVGGVLFRQLINSFGSASQVFSAPRRKLLGVRGLGSRMAEKLADNNHTLNEARDIWIRAKASGIRIADFKDENYPHRLRNLYDAPPVLYLKGTGSLNQPRTVGIVGTRMASEYGKKVTEEIVKALKPFDVQVISGLAYGIDIAAHKAALKNDLSTVAVLANGPDIVYPAVHKGYAREVEATGLLVSENPPGTLPVAPLFLARNRIIAALSDVVIVVESAQKGGAMVTAELANNYHKEVYAVPGNLYQRFSEGTLQLIQQNKARIFTNSEELAQNMGWYPGQSSAVMHSSARKIDLSMFTNEESAVISILMNKEECLIDELSWQSQIPLNRLASVLLNLEFMDIVEQAAGKHFRLK